MMVSTIGIMLEIATGYFEVVRKEESNRLSREERFHFVNKRLASVFGFCLSEFSISCLSECSSILRILCQGQKNRKRKWTSSEGKTKKGSERKTTDVSDIYLWFVYSFYFLLDEKTINPFKETEVFIWFVFFCSRKYKKFKPM